MKLTIEHLSCYLPYGLKFVNSEFAEYTFPLVSVSNISYELNDDDSGIEVILFDDETHIKPLLRPLSQLTETITHNGETFVPIAELSNLANEWLGIPIIKMAKTKGNINTIVTLKGYVFGFDNDGFYIKEGHNAWSVANQWKLWQKLFQWHFDVFGLIEQNLALQKQAQ